MRRAFALLLAVAVGAASCDAPTAPVRIDASFELVTYNGAPLPQFVPSPVDALLGFESTWLADTIVLHADGTGIKYAAWRRLRLADSTVSALATFATFTYSVKGTQLLVRWISCGDDCLFSLPTATMVLSSESTVISAAAGAAIYHRMAGTPTVVAAETRPLHIGRH